MKILRTKKALEEFVADARNARHTIGLVPTMGALHKGHLSLVNRATAENDVTVVSLFVNPTQFNNPADLATYPRKEKDDFELLESNGVDAVFAPSAEEIYPDGNKGPAHVFDLGRVAEVMEGAYRPGHFQGVAQIVSLLFQLAKPTRAYFGEKDFQQIAVIRRMAATEGFELEIVACPIVREDDGLALSSRNALLTPEDRKTAPGIHAILAESVNYSRDHSVEATHDSVVEAIDALPHCKVEYFDIVDGNTLQRIADWDESDYIVGCITVYCGKVRLIDNIKYRGN